jgi:hypothetical protein
MAKRISGSFFSSDSSWRSAAWVTWFTAYNPNSYQRRVLMKRFIVFIVALLACVSFLRAEEPKPAADLAAYLAQLQVKLEHTAQRANQPTSGGTSVVGLRGSKQEPLSKQLYWKGKAGNTPVTPEEIKLFRTAIEEAQAGNNDQATTTLKSLIEKYPKSGLKSDAEETLKLLISAQTVVSGTR